MFVCCECCVLSGRGLCDALITRPEESYRLWCVVGCDLETSRMRRPWPALDRSATGGGVGPTHYFRLVFLYCVLIAMYVCMHLYTYESNVYVIFYISADFEIGH